MQMLMKPEDRPEFSYETVARELSELWGKYQCRWETLKEVFRLKRQEKCQALLQTTSRHEREELREFLEVMQGVEELVDKVNAEVDGARKATKREVQNGA